MTESPEQWGAIPVAETPSDWGAVLVEESPESPEAWGAIPMEPMPESSIRYAPEIPRSALDLSVANEKMFQAGLPRPAVEPQKIFGLTTPLAEIPRVSSQMVQDAKETIAAWQAQLMTGGKIKAQDILGTRDVPPSESSKASAGALNVVSGAANFMLSPLGIATLGQGALPQIVRRLVSLGFAADMVSQLPEAARVAGEASVTGDTQEKVEAFGNAGVNALFAALTLKHGITPNAPVPIEKQREVVSELKTILTEAPKESPIIENLKAADAPLTAQAVEQKLSSPAPVEAPKPRAEGESEAVSSEAGITQSRDAQAQNIKPAMPESEKTQVVGEESNLSMEPSSQAMGISAGPLFADIPAKVKGFFQKNLTSEGNLPREVYDKWNQSRQAISAETKAIDYNVRDLYSALRKNHNISLGRYAARGMGDVPPAVIEQINRVLVGEADPVTLPDNVRAPVEKMRGHIDTLSKRMIDEGLIDETLAEKVGDNLGNYLTRSYRIFDNPEYAKKIPAGVLNRARSFLQGEMPNASPAEVDVKLREMVSDWSESGFDKQMAGGKLGSKDLTQFMKRKDIAPEIRDLLGEYKSPVINYARSVTKIARFISDQKFLNQVRSAGLGKFLFKEGESIPGFDVKLAAEGTSSMAPLNGLRTSPEIKEAFESFNKSKVVDNVFWKTWLGLTAASKTAKTVGSLLTQARNLIGQPFFNLMSGHWDVSQYAKSLKAIAADVGATDSQTWRDYYRKMTSLGIVNESVSSNELRASLKDAGLKDRTYADDPLTGFPRVVQKAGIEAPARAYQLSDELGKIVGFENELARMKRAYPNRDIASLEREAADRVRNTYPTYSMVPEAIKQFRKQPVFGPFVSFASETFRTTYHSLKYAAEDLKSSNPEVRKAGASRLLGITAALGLPAAIALTSREVNGIRKEEEEDVRRFLPPWSKNSQLMFLGRDNGTVDFVNLSYQNPYSFIPDTVIAAALNGNDKELQERFTDAFSEFLRPFTSEQMLAAAAMDNMRNKTKTGKQIFNPQDPWNKVWSDKTKHLLQAVEPGTLTRLRTKIVPSITDDQPDYGRKLEPGVEIGAELTGIRREKLDFKQGLTFKAKQFRESEQQAEYIFSGSVGKTGTVPNEALVENYRQSNESRFKVWKELYLDATAALRNGVPQDDVEVALESSGLSKDDRADLLDGIYSPTLMTSKAQESADRKAESAKREIPWDQIEAVQKEFIGRKLRNDSTNQMRDAGK